MCVEPHCCPAHPPLSVIPCVNNVIAEVVHLHCFAYHGFVIVAFFPSFGCCQNWVIFLTGTPDQGLLHDFTDDYCITLSIFGHLHPLTFYGLDQKYLFMDPETLLDGTPNLE